MRRRTQSWLRNHCAARLNVVSCMHVPLVHMEAGLAGGTARDGLTGTVVTVLTSHTMCIWLRVCVRASQGIVFDGWQPNRADCGGGSRDGGAVPAPGRGNAQRQQAMMKPLLEALHTDNAVGESGQRR
jgi:hypothetical protein